MDLVDEQQRLAATDAKRSRAPSSTSRSSLTPSVTALSWRNWLTALARQQAGQRRLASARRAIENHRSQPVGLQQPAQQLALAQKVLLADEFFERRGRIRAASGWACWNRAASASSNSDLLTRLPFSGMRPTCGVWVVLPSRSPSEQAPLPVRPREAAETASASKSGVSASIQLVLAHKQPKRRRNSVRVRGCTAHATAEATVVQFPSPRVDRIRATQRGGVPTARWRSSHSRTTAARSGAVAAACNTPSPSARLPAPPRESPRISWSFRPGITGATNTLTGTPARAKAATARNRAAGVRRTRFQHPGQLGVERRNAQATPAQAAAGPSRPTDPGRGATARSWRRSSSAGWPRDITSNTPRVMRTLPLARLVTIGHADNAIGSPLQPGRPNSAPQQLGPRRT